MTTLKSQTGIDLYALSIQNEPDYVAQWDSCIWTGAEFQNFIKNFLAPTFAVAALTTKVIMPEASGWDFTLAAPTLNDPVAAAGVQIIAAHGYSGSIAAPCPLGKVTANDCGRQKFRILRRSIPPFRADLYMQRKFTTGSSPAE